MTPKIGHDPIPLVQQQAKPLVQQQAMPLHPVAKQGKAADAADQFETMMALQMVRGMQSTLESGSMFGGGTAGDIYNGLAEWQLAKTLTKGSHLGLKEQILRQLPKAEEQAK